MTTASRPGRPIAFWLLAAAVLGDLSVLLLGSLRNYVHLHVVLLVLQYGVLLPIVVWYLRGARSARGYGLPTANLPVVMVCFAALALPLSWFSVQGLMNPDESGYSFQARIYRSGRIMADPLIGATAKVRDTPGELFYANHVLLPTGWFPKFPPGWPLVLSLGYLISARWLLNPLFGGLQLFVIAAIGRRIFSRQAGLVAEGKIAGGKIAEGTTAALLATLSSFYLVNSIGMMSHAFCAILSAAACLALFAGIRTGKLPYFAGMFACLAATLQVRPYTGFVTTFVLTIAALWCMRKNRAALAGVFAVGVLFGMLALAGVVVYNHTYTGHWLVSPYALAAGAGVPPELSFNPVRVWQGIAQYGRQTFEESLIGAFPFLYLLAGYTLLRERRLKTEVWILGALYVCLVFAYLAHPDGSGVFFGERFHFESFFAVALLAARGLQLLLEKWQTPRPAAVSALTLLGILALGQLAAAVEAVSRRGEPYRKVRAAMERSGDTGIVFLRDSPGLFAKHINLNDADWHHAARIYLVDAEPDRRAEWACRYGFSSWMVASYDPAIHDAVLEKGQTTCPAALQAP